MESEAYQNLLALSEQQRLVGDAQALLGWDQEVLLPSSGVEYRGKQMSWFSGWLHEQGTRPEVGEWISDAEEQASLLEGEGSEAVRANLREWRRNYDRETKLPKRLVEELAKAQTEAKSAWASAREKANFSEFAPHLEKLISLCREQASCWGFEGDRTYDGLIDKFEPGANAERLDSILGELRESLVPIVAEATARKGFDEQRLEGHYPVEQQEAFNREVAEAMGFDFDSGRIDTAVHPFCSGMAPHDVRLTTRYDVADFRSSLFGVLHEAGHGLYEQGLKNEWHSQPIGNAASLGVHESQSRLWENHVGRSLPFWEVWMPRASHFFPNLLGLTASEMFEAVNQAKLSHIRVESDEVTYDLHILLRFELEREIFAGNLAVSEIPDAWNERFESYFGLPVENDAEGCLQDIHWSMGIFGYFPTYSLGNINAAHLAKSARSDEEVNKGFVDGDFAPLLQWMRRRIHESGSLYLPDDLVEHAAGTPADSLALVEHLKERYLPS